MIGVSAQAPSFSYGVKRLNVIHNCKGFCYAWKLCYTGGAMRVTAEVGYLNKLKDDGSVPNIEHSDHVQAYLSHRGKSHREEETPHPSSKMNRRDEMSKYLSTHVGEVLGGLYDA